MSSINAQNHHHYNTRPTTNNNKRNNNRCQLLEINIISAQDLATLSKSMHTYAVAWINPSRKLTTLVDPKGHNSPTWNDKFVFRVDSEFLNSETAVVMIEIYNQAWLRDVIVGSVRVLVSSLIPHQKSSTRFVALQIRRPSGRPQGILNVGVSLVDGVMKSMPLCSELGSSGLGCSQNNTKSRGSSMLDINCKDRDNRRSDNIVSMSKLRRTKSDGTWSLKDQQQPDGATSSICNGSGGGAGSMVGTELSAAGGGHRNGKGKGGSINHNGSSLCSDVGPSPSVVAAAVAKGIYPLRLGNNNNNNNNNKGDDGSSILQWTDAGDEESVEGLRSKLERWRMEIGRPSYNDDARKMSKYMNNRQMKSKRRRSGRRSSSGGEGGGYSCFAKVFGCEFTIVCGANPSSKKHSSKVHLSPSDDQNSDIYGS